MRYPPRGQGARIQRERLPQPGPTGDVDITHNDMHLNNIMFGEMDANDREHQLGPTAKVSCNIAAYNIRLE